MCGFVGGSSEVQREAGEIRKKSVGSGDEREARNESWEHKEESEAAVRYAHDVNFLAY